MTAKRSSTGRVAGYLFLAALAGLIALAVLEADGWSQRQLLLWGAGFFHVFGAGYVLGHLYAGESGVLRGLVRHVHYARGRLVRFWGPGKPLAKAATCFGLGTLLLLITLLQA